MREFSVAATAGADVSEASKSKLPRLRIGKIDVEHPIVQGGMGVGVSNSNLAGAVAKYGAVGTLSSVGLSKIPLYKGMFNKMIIDAKKSL